MPTLPRQAIFGALPRGILVLTLSFGCSGCGVLLQTAFGWSSESTRVEGNTQDIKVETDPPGAEIRRRGPGNHEERLGESPLTDSIAYQTQVVEEHPKFAGLLIGAAVQGAIAAGMFAAGSETTSASQAGFFASAGFMTYFALQDLIIAAVHGSGDATVKKRSTIGTRDYAYLAGKKGYTGNAQMVKVPDQSQVRIVLQQPLDPTQASRPAPALVVPAAPQKLAHADWIVAVMDVQDVNSSSDNAFDAGLMRNLSDQLRVYVAEAGIRTIDRGAQDNALQETVAQLKNSSYESCYDEQCQIELGKALAATHLLRSKITRFGTRCVLNAELIDLRREITMKAASERGDCQAEGFLNMSQAVAGRLIGE